MLVREVNCTLSLNFMMFNIVSEYWFCNVILLKIFAVGYIML